MKIKSPCKDCKDRFIGCHSTLCPHGWIEFEKGLEEERSERAKKNEAKYQVNAFALKRIDNCKKARNGK